MGKEKRKKRESKKAKSTSKKKKPIKTPTTLEGKLAKIERKIENAGALSLTDEEWDYKKASIVHGVTGKWPPWAIAKYHDLN